MNVLVPNPLKVLPKLIRSAGQVLLAGVLLMAGLLILAWMFLVFLAGWIAGALLVSVVVLRILVRSMLLRYRT